MSLAWYSQKASWIVSAAALSTARLRYTALRAIIPRAAAWIAMAAIVRRSSSVSPSSANASPAMLPAERKLRGRPLECLAVLRRRPPTVREDAPVRWLPPPEEVVEAADTADFAKWTVNGFRRASPGPAGPPRVSRSLNAQPEASGFAGGRAVKGSSVAAPGPAPSITRHPSMP